MAAVEEEINNETVTFKSLVRGINKFILTFQRLEMKTNNVRFIWLVRVLLMFCAKPVSNLVGRHRQKFKGKLFRWHYKVGYNMMF